MPPWCRLLLPVRGPDAGTTKSQTEFFVRPRCQRLTFTIKVVDCACIAGLAASTRWLASLQTRRQRNPQKLIVSQGRGCAWVYLDPLVRDNGGSVRANRSASGESAPFPLIVQTAGGILDDGSLIELIPDSSPPRALALLRWDGRSWNSAFKSSAEASSTFPRPPSERQGCLETAVKLRAGRDHGSTLRQTHGSL